MNWRKPSVSWAKERVYFCYAISKKKNWKDWETKAGAKGYGQSVLAIHPFSIQYWIECKIVNDAIEVFIFPIEVKGLKSKKR